jgi:hypothetical protein
VFAAALALAACGGGGDKDDTSRAHGLPNISLAGSPNGTRVGPVDPHRESIHVPVEGRAIVAAFRASECGHPAPDFARTMKRQVLDGLKVPNGITLYDAGIGHYTSSRCKARAEARAIGVYASSPGTYALQFFGGKTVRTVKVP